MAKVSALTDDFSGPFDWAKWNGSYGAVDTVDGRARLAVLATYSGVATSTTYDLTESAFFVKVTPPSQPGNGSKEFFVEANVDGNNSLSFFQSGSTDLVMRLRQDGVNSQTSVAYDAVSMAYWRIRASGGNAYFDTSPDGATWTTRRTVAVSMPLTAVWVNIAAGYWGSSESPDYAYIDNFNVIPPLHEFSDDFDDGVLDPEYEVYGTVEETGGRLRVATMSTGSGAYTRRAWRLVGSQVTFRQYLDATPGSRTDVFVEGAALGDRMLVRLQGASLHCRVETSYYDPSPTIVPLDPTAHAWLRLRETAGTAYIEASPDGLVWSVLREAPSPAWVSENVLFQIDGRRTSGTASFSEIDNLNVPPSSTVQLSVSTSWMTLAKVASHEIGDPGTQGDLEWSGYQWLRRPASEGGAPTYNGKWDPDGVVRNGDGSVTLTISNPSGNDPAAAEMYTTRRDWGYGTYTSIVDTRLDTLPKAVVFGGLFTYDDATPPHNNEIDIHETSAWGGGPAQDRPVNVEHVHFYNNAGTRAILVSGSTAVPATAVQTHVMRWEPGKITWDSYEGEGTDGALILHSETTQNIPVPATERLVLNLWVFDGNNGSPATVPDGTAVTVRSMSFTALDAPFVPLSFSTSWNALSRTESVRTSAWRTLGAAQATLGPVEWQVAKTLTAMPQDALWDTRAQLATSTSTAWQIAASVAAAGTTHWRTRVQLTASTSASWHARMQLAETAESTWQTAALVATSVSAAWHARMQLVETVASTWQTAALVTATRSAAWYTHMQLVETAASTWHARAQLATFTSANWHTRAQLTETAESAWHARAQLIETAESTWQTAALATASASASWHARMQLAASASTGWQIAALVAAARGAVWYTRAQLAASVSASWHAAAQIAETAESTWHTTALVTAARSAAWRVVATVLQTGQAVSWLVYAPAESTSTSTAWQTTSLTSVEAAAIWRTTVAAAADSTTRWHTTSAADVAEYTTWSVLAELTDSSWAAAWNTYVRTATSVFELWHVGGSRDITVRGSLAAGRVTAAVVSSSRVQSVVAPSRIHSRLNKE